MGVRDIGSWKRKPAPVEKSAKLWSISRTAELVAPPNDMLASIANIGWNQYPAASTTPEDEGKNAVESGAIS